MHSFMVVRLPVPLGDDEARDFIHRIDDEQSQREPLAVEFLPFIAKLTERYPEFTQLPADDFESSVWAEGPLIRCGSGDLLWVSVSGRHLDKGVEEFLVATSRLFGFTALDTESGNVHRP